MKKICLFSMQTLMVLSLFFAVSCEVTAVIDDGNEVPDGKFKIGQDYQGGVVAYVDATGEHGLIAAPHDLSIGMRWHNGEHLVTEATGTTIGTGKNNTAMIIQMQGNGAYAAKLCADLVIDEYDDWFLPSKDELNELYKNRAKIGGFSYTGIYWSSSEKDNANAWYQSFYYGYDVYNTYYGKQQTYRVRAVRTF